MENQNKLQDIKPDTSNELSKSSQSKKNKIFGPISSD